jgi:hypothetical protein
VHEEAYSPVILSQTLLLSLFSFVFVWEAQKETVLLSTKTITSTF